MAIKDELYTNFVLNVREILERRQLTQEDLAARTGKHRTNVTAVLNFHNSPSLRTVTQFANALGVSPVTLLQTPLFPQTNTCQ